MICLRANKNLKDRRENGRSVRSETILQAKRQQIETKSLTYTFRYSNPHLSVFRREVRVQDSPDFALVCPVYIKHTRC